MAPKKERFWWFRGESVEQLTADLNSMSQCRLEVHLNGNDMTLHVIPEGIGTADAGGVTNQSHVCPPICP